MDILEQGTERDPVSPLRRRVATGLAVAVALGIVVARHHPGGEAQPPPVADSAVATAAPTPSATPTRSAVPPTPAPDPALARVAMPCDWFLAQLALPKLDKWHAKVVSTKRVANTQTRTYRRAGGVIAISAGCGPIKWVLPLGAAEDTFLYADVPGDGKSPAMVVWRTDPLVGWYRITSDGPHGSVLSKAEASHLVEAIEAGAKSV